MTQNRRSKLRKGLVILSSPRGKNSISNQIALRQIEAWEKQGFNSIDILDLNKVNLPFLDDITVNAYFTKTSELSEMQKEKLELSHSLTNQLLNCTDLLIATPTWNFNVPARLKAWIDLVVRVGVTFRYQATGEPEGLLKNLENVVIVEAHGGSLEGKPWGGAAQYLHQVLHFMGAPKIKVLSVDDLPVLEVEMQLQ